MLGDELTHGVDQSVANVVDQQPVVRLGEEELYEGVRGERRRPRVGLRRTSSKRRESVSSATNRSSPCGGWTPGKPAAGRTGQGRLGGRGRRARLAATRPASSSDARTARRNHREPGRKRLWRNGRLPAPSATPGRRRRDQSASAGGASPRTSSLQGVPGGSVRSSAGRLRPSPGVARGRRSRAPERRRRRSPSPSRRLPRALRVPLLNRRNRTRHRRGRPGTRVAPCRRARRPRRRPSAVCAVRVPPGRCTIVADSAERRTRSGRRVVLHVRRRSCRTDRATGIEPAFSEWTDPRSGQRPASLTTTDPRSPLLTTSAQAKVTLSAICVSGRPVFADAPRRPRRSPGTARQRRRRTSAHREHHEPSDEGARPPPRRTSRQASSRCSVSSRRSRSDSASARTKTCHVTPSGGRGGLRGQGTRPCR